MIIKKRPERQCMSQKLNNTWFAIIPGDILPMSPSSGHLGQRSLRQKLRVGSSCGIFVGFSPLIQMELNTAGQSKVAEQLGHDKVSGSHPWYLQYNPRHISSRKKYIHYVIVVNFHEIHLWRYNKHNRILQNFDRNKNYWKVIKIMKKKTAEWKKIVTSPYHLQRTREH